MMPLTELIDVSIQWRPVAGKLLGYGTLALEVKSGGQKQGLETLRYMPRPEKVIRMFTELISDEKTDEGKDHEDDV